MEGRHDSAGRVLEPGKAARRLRGARLAPPYHGRRRRFTIVRTGGTMSYRETEHLRVLIANERRDRLALVAPIVAALGHEVIAREVEVDDVRRRHRQGATRRRARRAGRELRARTRGLITRIVQEAACPVIAPDPRARSRLHQGGVEAVLLCLHHRRRRRRLAELDRHRAAPLCRVPRPRRRVRAPRAGRAGEGHPDGTPLGRRQRRRVDMLREHSRTSNRKLVDVATAVVDGHALLPKGSGLR